MRNPDAAMSLAGHLEIDAAGLVAHPNAVGVEGRDLCVHLLAEPYGPHAVGRRLQAEPVRALGPLRRGAGSCTTWSGTSARSPPAALCEPARPWSSAAVPGGLVAGIASGSRGTRRAVTRLAGARRRAPPAAAGDEALVRAYRALLFAPVALGSGRCGFRPCSMAGLSRSPGTAISMAARLAARQPAAGRAARSERQLRAPDCIRAVRFFFFFLFITLLIFYGGPFSSAPTAELCGERRTGESVLIAALALALDPEPAPKPAYAPPP